MPNNQISLQFLEDFNSLSEPTRNELNQLFYKYAHPNMPLTVRCMLGDNTGNIVDVVAMMMFQGSKERDMRNMFQHTKIEPLPDEVMNILTDYHKFQNENAEQFTANLDARYSEAKEFHAAVIKHFSKKRKWKGFPIVQFANAGFQELARVLDEYAKRYNKELQEVGNYINKHKQG